MRQRPMSTLIFGILNIGYGLLYKLGGIVATVIMSRIKMPGNAGMEAMQADPTIVAYTKFMLPLGVVLALALVACGIGLLFLKNWARLGSMFWSVLEIVSVVVGTIVVWPATRRMME